MENLKSIGDISSGFRLFRIRTDFLRCHGKFSKFFGPSPRKHLSTVYRGLQVSVCDGCLFAIFSVAVNTIATSLCSILDIDSILPHAKGHVWAITLGGAVSPGSGAKHYPLASGFSCPEGGNRGGHRLLWHGHGFSHFSCRKK